MISQGVTPVANGTIKRSPVNKEYTTVNSNLAYEVKNDIVFVYIIKASASGNAWTEIGTIPTELAPPAEVAAMGFGGNYGNSYWTATHVTASGSVGIGVNGSTARVNVYSTIIYPYPS